MPKEVIRAIVAIVMNHKEAIVKREGGKWVVVENIRRLAYMESESNK